MTRRIFTGLYALSQFNAGQRDASIGIGMGILGTGFFGLCTVAAVISLLPGGSWLRLDGSNFEVSAPFRKRKFRWSREYAISAYFAGGPAVASYSRQRRRALMY